MTETEQAIEILKTYLKQHRLRRTEEREYILTYIYSLDAHFTPQSLFDELNKKFRVSLATIYNTLNLLVEAQLIVRHPFSIQHIEYEKITSSYTHHHRICTQCGKVTEFRDIKIKRAIKNRKFSGFEPTHYSLYLYGICKKCQDKNKKLQNKQKK